MAKSKRKPSASQRDKDAIEVAKILKRKGIISKSTKLHGGKYISRGVLNKVQQYQHAAKSHYRAVKVPKKLAAAAKGEGYQVVHGNKVIVPSDHDFIKRLKTGVVSGIKPVKGGFMSEVTLPFEPHTANQLLRAVDEGDIDELRLPHEQFAFSFNGAMSYRAFLDASQMKEYLMRYKQNEIIKAIKVYRLHPEDVSRYIKPRELRPKTVKRRRRPNGSTWADKIARMPEKKAERLLAERAAASARHRARLVADPAKLEAYKMAARERARLSAFNRKGK